MFALTSYLKTGKDTLIVDFQNNVLKMNIDKSPDEVKWVIYGSTSANVSKIEDLLNYSQFIKRYSFADALKQRTHEYLQILNCPIHAFEKVKDTAKFVDPHDSSLFQTIRDFYIYFGQKERKKDPFVWTTIVHEQIKKDQKESFFVLPIISDFRFENELLFPNTTTIRLHRKIVPIPNLASNIMEDPEHNLDNFLTDFLFLPKGQDEFEIAVQRFPQYCKFVPLANLCI